MNSRSPAPGGRLLSLGSINADFQVRADRRPEVSETLIAREFTRLGGGKAANRALLAARMGLEAALFGQVGDDDLAAQALAAVREAGVRLEGVHRRAGHDTAVSMITVPPDGKKGIVLAANANDAPWLQDDLRALDDALRAAPQGSVFAVDAEIDAEALRRALCTARAAGLRTVLDPSPADRVDESILALCDLVLPNAGEAQALTGIAVEDFASAGRAARRLRQLGARAACVKLADGGCVFDDGQQLLAVEAGPEVEVIDTTGAGDAFAGGLAAALALGRPLEQALRMAVAASRCTVTGWGSQPAYPELAAVESGAQALQVRRDVVARD
ncbi:PfkB family carbohydrate kinase [Ramlibacter sp. AN1015]|uniref:PfkB family carbohydrate kinase n=1 Tax=Ramlibacter sp. AN1015 TaxID=3133428 RepID=UPI0030BDB81E